MNRKLFLIMFLAMSTFAACAMESNQDAYMNAISAGGLKIACEQGDKEGLKTLLEYGADPNVQGYIPLNAGDYIPIPLIIAAKKGYTGLVEVLLNAHADPNRQDNEGETALMVAAQWGNKDIVALLLKTGARVDLKNNDGKTAIDLASGYPDVQKYIISKITVEPLVDLAIPAAAEQVKKNRSLLNKLPEYLQEKVEEYLKQNA